MSAIRFKLRDVTIMQCDGFEGGFPLSICVLSEDHSVRKWRRGGEQHVGFIVTSSLLRRLFRSAFRASFGNSAAESGERRRIKQRWAETL
jgi:hypothetical protein